MDLVLWSHREMLPRSTVQERSERPMLRPCESLSSVDTLFGSVPPASTVSFMSAADWLRVLDRRQIQLDAGGVASLGRVVGAIRQRGGVGAFYAGFVPNALKNLPNKGVPGFHPFMPAMLVSGLLPTAACLHEKLAAQTD